LIHILYDEFTTYDHALTRPAMLIASEGRGGKCFFWRNRQ